MLGKLMKYDMINLGRSVLPAYLCMVVIAVVDCLLQILKSADFMADVPAVNYIASTTHMMVFGGVVCLFFILLIIGCKYYKSNIMEDEGYLMHTLPVSANQLLASKVISFMAFVLLTAVVSYLVLAVAVREPLTFQKLYDTFMFGFGKQKAVLFCVLLGLYIFIYLLFLIVAAYLAFSVGYSCVTKARGFAAGGIFVLLYNLGKVGELLAVFGFGRRGAMNQQLEDIAISDLMWLVIPLFILYIVLSGVCYLQTGRWLKNRLNLD